MKEKGIELSHSERNALKSVVTSDGWKVLTEHLWRDAKQLITENFIVCKPSDLERLQGIYTGIKLVEDLTVMYADPFKPIQTVNNDLESKLTAKSSDKGTL